MTQKTYTPRENSGSLFYDSPGAVTMKGNLQLGKRREVTAEPATDKQQREYIKINGEGISGALYQNDRKTEDRHPDYTGPMEIDRVKYRISAWKKEIKNGDSAGQEFLSMAFNEKTENPSS